MKSSASTQRVGARHRRRRPANGCILVPFCIATLLGCSPADDPPTGIRTPTGGPSFTLNPVRPDGRPKYLDEIFAEIAAHVPGYAGTYYDADGTPITNLVDLSRGPDAERAIGFLINNGKNGEGPRKSKLKKVAHDFLKLKEWKDKATLTLLARPYVVSVDIDEANNRLKIGVANGAEEANANRFLRENKIPGLVATMIPVDTSPDYNRPPGSPETLRNTQSLYGGVAIHPGVTKTCSLGFNAMLSVIDGNGSTRLYSYDHFFVTASHCMWSLGYPSNTPIYQNNDQYGNTRVIGYEFRQPEWLGQERYYDCPGGSRCSTAESALIRYNAPWGGARIARVSGNPGTNSITLDPYYPPWQVADSVGDNTLLNGATLYKVGQTTGWTQGTVTETCANYRILLGGTPTQFVALCQWSASCGSAGGDSGGPVFKNKFGYYPQVQLVGNVWAGISSVSTFSFYPYIDYELTTRDTQSVCGSQPCWPRLTVSNY